MSKTYLITGASEGIGLETARLAAQEGAAVLMVSRDRTKLTAAAATVTGAIAPETAAVDLTDPVALDAFIASLDARGYLPRRTGQQCRTGLVGRVRGSRLATSRRDAAVERQCAGQAYPLGRTADEGEALRRHRQPFGAVATRPVPFFAAYAASKAFVNNLSQAIHHELKPFGVSVSAVHPPAVRTGFAAPEKADLKSTLVLKLFPTVGPKTVARAVLTAARRRRRSVIIGPVAGIVMGTAPIMPRGMDLAFMSLLFKRERLDRPA